MIHSSGAGEGGQLSDGSPCLRHGCVTCCIETEMPLVEEDLRRIERLGYRRVDFTIQIGGEMLLRNIGKNCFFLEEGKCKIYIDRPEGCKIYPLVYDVEACKFVYDSVCPHGSDFSITRRDKERLKRLIRRLDREAVKE